MPFDYEPSKSCNIKQVSKLCRRLCIIGELRGSCGKQLLHTIRKGREFRSHRPAAHDTRSWTSTKQQSSFLTRPGSRHSVSFFPHFLKCMYLAQWHPPILDLFRNFLYWKFSFILIKYFTECVTTHYLILYPCIKAVCRLWYQIGLTLKLCSLINSCENLGKLL